MQRLALAAENMSKRIPCFGGKWAILDVAMILVTFGLFH